MFGPLPRCSSPSFGTPRDCVPQRRIRGCSSRCDVLVWSSEIDLSQNRSFHAPIITTAFVDGLDYASRVTGVLRPRYLLGRGHGAIPLVDTFAPRSTLRAPGREPVSHPNSKIPPRFDSRQRACRLRLVHRCSLDAPALAELILNGAHGDQVAFFLCLKSLPQSSFPVLTSISFICRGSCLCETQPGLPYHPLSSPPVLFPALSHPHPDQPMPCLRLNQRHFRPRVTPMAASQKPSHWVRWTIRSKKSARPSRTQWIRNASAESQFPRFDFPCAFIS
ncbi:hypothetical protein B0H14DRAFT_3870557 [Mycena olivaceomarginata]|nr:hypothetical protein B0H14DRAFT_3870557 [Mycena olivaceomarginata]